MSARPLDTLMKEVIGSGLCTRCGTCVGACPEGNLRINDPIGSCLPEAGEFCSRCGLCLSACPGRLMEFEPIERDLFKTIRSSSFLGVVRSAWLAHANDPETRRRGSSGGVVTSLLLDALDRKTIGGAILFAPHSKEPYRGWGKIAKDREEIILSAQSRYHLSPLNTVLSEIRSCDSRIAYVGIPCQVHGLRKLQRSGWRSRVSLSPVIGIYCGNNLFFAATVAMMRKLGVKSIEEVEAISYREGRWPGSFSVRTRNGQERSVSKLYFNQAIPFYINRRCLFCVDLSNELSDISVGDGWSKEGSEEGWSVVLLRSEAGEEAFTRALERGSIAAERISLEEAELMHAHAIDLKKIGSFLRISLWKKFGCAVPSYDRPFPKVSFGRRAIELLVSLQFVIASSSIGRALFSALPLTGTGRLFSWVRKIWMRNAAKHRGRT